MYRVVISHLLYSVPYQRSEVVSTIYVHYREMNTKDDNKSTNGLRHAKSTIDYETPEVQSDYDTLEEQICHNLNTFRLIHW